MTIEPPGRLLLVYECYNMLSICINVWGRVLLVHNRLASIDFSLFE
jgi:hypothetical protein